MGTSSKTRDSAVIGGLSVTSFSAALFNAARAGVAAVTLIPSAPSVIEEFLGRSNRYDKSIVGWSFGSGRALLDRLGRERCASGSRLEPSRNEVLIEQIQIEKYYDAPDAIGARGAEQFQIHDTAC